MFYPEKAMAPHSSTLAWKIPWTEEPGRLQSMGSQRVGHDWATSLSFHFHALEKEMATHSSVLAWRIPGTGGGPRGLLSRVEQSRTRLTRLSSSSKCFIMIRFRWCTSARNPTEVVLSPFCALCGDVCCWLVPMLLTLIISLRWCLPDFFIV